MRIYVSNLRSEVSDEDLRKAFESVGKVASAIIVKTTTSNEASGLGFVEMSNTTDVFRAFKSLNGKLLKGNPIKIYDRRQTDERRLNAERRSDRSRRLADKRRSLNRRRETGEEELVHLFNDLERRNGFEKRIGIERRGIEERRLGTERRDYIERRQQV